MYPHLPHLVIMGINERINNGGSIRVIFLPLPFFPTLASCVYLFAVNFIDISQNSLIGEKNLPLKKKMMSIQGLGLCAFKAEAQVQSQHRFNPACHMEQPKKKSHSFFGKTMGLSSEKDKTRGKKNVNESGT